ncbi:MAG: DUF1573 domain-containing protein [Chitinophagaceae bacterium]
MKKLYFLLVAVVLCLNVFSQPPTPTQSYADQVAIFKEPTHDFGKIKEGSPTVYEFTFTNKNNKPIILSNVETSCGCTVPEWPRTPIAPNQTGRIKVTYDSKRIGYFEKTIQVYVQGFTVGVFLKIKGNVLTTEQYNREEKK